MPFITTEKFDEICKNPNTWVELKDIILEACTTLSNHCHSVRYGLTEEGRPLLLFEWYAFTYIEPPLSPSMPKKERDEYRKAQNRKEKDWLNTYLPELPESIEFEGFTIALKHTKESMGKLL